MEGEEVSLLCVSDIHGKVDVAKAFVKELSQSSVLERINIIVVAGDVGNPQRSDAFYSVMGELAKLGKPIYYVRGNWDVNAPSGIFAEDPLIADLEAISPLDLGVAVLVGHGKRLRPFRGVRSKPVVLVTHYPPFSILDKGKKLESPYQSLHAGLPEINYLISYYKPVLHIFGHSHSFGGIDVKHNGVIYANVSRLDRVGRSGNYIGNYAIITLRRGGGVSIRWRFLNGIWKRCSRCGRRTHLPSEWTLCRKCANRFDLGFKRLSKDLEKVEVIVSEVGGGELLHEVFHVPISTLKDEEAYADFIDYMMLKRLREVVEGLGDKLVTLPKDRVIEYYSEEPEELIPFSEYLFACDSSKVGEKICALMRLYMLDKRAHVLWRLSRNGDSTLISKEYVLASEEALCHEQLVRDLIRQGFTPLAYSVKKGVENV